MGNFDIKELFQISDSKKTQIQNFVTWQWTFQSLISSHVQVNVTTYGSERRAEDDAWKELEKIIVLSMKRV